MTGGVPFNGNTNAEIYYKIIRKGVKFPSPLELSVSFVDFCQSSLIKSPVKRLTIEEALRHPWVLGIDISDNTISENVLNVLRQFNVQSKLKKLISRALAAHLGKQSEEQIREQFNIVDVNGDGILSASELAMLLEKMGLDVEESKRESAMIIASLDKDCSGGIEFGKFAEIWQRKLLTDEENIKSVFKVLDSDGNGVVDVEELAMVLDMNEEADRGKVEEIIREVDTNGDGVLCFKEFRQAMLENNFSKDHVNLGLKLDTVDITNSDMGTIDLDSMVITEEPNLDGACL